MKTAQKITYSALFTALGLILPFFTGQLQQFGNMLLPMHLPVFLCGLICGWKYGFSVGLILPIFRSMLFGGKPPMYPVAICMAFELSCYGFVAGFLYEKRPWKCLKSLYISLICAMVVGRIVWGVVRWILFGMFGTAFSWEFFVAESITNAIPGIILQLIVIPALMLSLHRTKFVRFHKKKEQESHEHK